MLAFLHNLTEWPLAEMSLLGAVGAISAWLARSNLPPRWRGRGLLLAPVTVLAIAAAYWGTQPPQGDVLADTYLPERSDDKGFASSQTCRSCHPGEYASWHRTYHRTMTQVAGASTVVDAARRDFDGHRELAGHGQTARLLRRNSEFWVDMVNPEWDKAQAAGIPEAVAVRTPEHVQRRVMLTTGSHHFQVFWVTSARTGELWQFPWRFHIGESRWVHRNDVFLQPPDKPALSHFRTWNHQCIHCHNVGGEPGLGAPPQNLFSNTRVGEIGIACEACHGPAEAHVRKYRNPTNRLADRVQHGEKHGVINPGTATPKMASQVCGQCHSHMVNHEGDVDRARDFLKTGLAYRPGDDLDQFARFLKLGDGYPGNEHRFWADGNCRSGGREYNGLRSSPCYQVPARAGDSSRQMSCLSCHSMHAAPANDQLKPIAGTNTACTSCHDILSDDDALTAHTHHGATSAGSQCYNCHMPHTSYALFKAIRTHQIDSPRVVPTRPNSRPNACNLCHLDQTLAWSAGHLSRWYNQPTVELNGTDREVAAAVGWLLAGDAGQRAIAAWHFGWKPAQQASGTGWMPPRLAPALNDPYPAVRWLAWQSLKGIPGVPEFEFDFDGTAAHRRSVMRTLSADRPGDTAPPRLLTRPDGKLDRQKLDEIIRSRDNRRVEIYE